jgi:hypothetical protein
MTNLLRGRDNLQSHKGKNARNIRFSDAPKRRCGIEQDLKEEI